jgi:hypothetical protein
VELSLTDTHILSVHDHPQKWRRRLSELLTIVALSAVAIISLTQLLLAITVSPLFVGTAVFTVILALPLLLQSVLHPEITVVEAGLYLRPLLWRQDYITWDRISGLSEHPLLYQDPVMERKLHGKNVKLRQGHLVVLDRDASALWLYRILGGIAGLRWRPAFAISSSTHRDYERLVELITERIVSNST